jgi:urease accessory protein
MASLSNREVRAADGLERARGVGRLTTVVRDQATRIATFYQEGCAKIRLPHTFDSSLQAVLINTAGGLCGGDEISWEADAAPGARVVLTTQACERVYRSLGAEARIETRLSAGPGASLKSLPQETVIYEGARVDPRVEVDL